MRLAACWAHVLRRFRDAVADFPDAQVMLAWIGDLYRIDERAADLADRRRLRNTESRAVLEKMRGWMLESRALKTTSLGSAIRYTMRNWERLSAFADEPLVWLDNNPTERGLRGPVVGRRNHFGSKSARGTEAAAILYSLVESAKVCGVDPIAYLNDLRRMLLHRRPRPEELAQTGRFVARDSVCSCHHDPHGIERGNSEAGKNWLTVIGIFLVLQNLVPPRTGHILQNYLTEVHPNIHSQ